MDLWDSQNVEKFCYEWVIKEAKTGNLPSHGGTGQEQNLVQINLESLHCRERLQAGRKGDGVRKRKEMSRWKEGRSWAAGRKEARKIREEGGKDERAKPAGNTDPEPEWLTKQYLTTKNKNNKRVLVWSHS